MTTSAPIVDCRTDAAAGGHSPASRGSALLMARIWAMPSADTLSVQEIRAWVKKYLMRAKCSIDPFARNCRLAQWRNDLNPETAAEYHMDVLDFLKMLEEKQVRPDLIIWDPPYSPNQIKESYESIGMFMPTKRLKGWPDERDVMARIQPVGGTVLSFGWSSNGMGTGRKYALKEVLLVSHGATHNDTICIAETKSEPEATLFDTQNAQVERRAPSTFAPTPGSAK
jgi:hypothetical protein